MGISVLITTFNRPADLCECLESLCGQTRTPDEVVVVDNGPSHQTRALVESFGARLPIRYVTEPQRGVCHARNRALESAAHDILGFIDDDCIVDENWVEVVTTSFKNPENHDVIVGNSMNYYRCNVVAQASYFFYAKWFKSAENIFDTKNITFKKSLVEKYNLYFKSNLYYGEDINFGQQLLDLGRKIEYNSDMIVLHKEPTRIRHFLRSRFQRGQMVYFLKNVSEKKPKFGKDTQVNHGTIKRKLLGELSNQLPPLSRPAFLILLLAGYFAQRMGYLRDYWAYRSSAWAV